MPLLIFKGLYNPWLECSQRGTQIINKTTKWDRGGEGEEEAVPSAACLEPGYVSDTAGAEERQPGSRLPCFSPRPSVLPSKQVERLTLGKGRVISSWSLVALARAALQAAVGAQRLSLEAVKARKPSIGRDAQEAGVGEAQREVCLLP